MRRQRRSLPRTRNNLPRDFFLNSRYRTPTSKAVLDKASSVTHQAVDAVLTSGSLTQSSVSSVVHHAVDAAVDTAASATVAYLDACNYIAQTALNMAKVDKGTQTREDFTCRAKGRGSVF